MIISNGNLIKVWSKEAISVVSKPFNVEIKGIKYCAPITDTLKKSSYTKVSGLRSMQAIKGTEREIIEAYRNELTHDIWGNPEKFREWVNKKFEELANKNYSSSKLDEQVVKTERNEAVKDWVKLIQENIRCNNNPFLKLKILRSIVEDLAQDNAQLAPIINQKIFYDAVHSMIKTGASFKKTYYKLLREFDTKLNVKTEEITENNIRGKWFSLKIPNKAEAEHNPGLFNKVKEFISVLSQGTNWCTRNPKSVGNEFIGCDFHIFIDSKGHPQICMVGTDKSGGWFKFIRGNNQYAFLPNKYKEILKSFLERHKLNNALVGRSETKTVHILDFVNN